MDVLSGIQCLKDVQGKGAGAGAGYVRMEGVERIIVFWRIWAVKEGCCVATAVEVAMRRTVCGGFEGELLLK
jgi:hypothetical protein